LEIFQEQVVASSSASNYASSEDIPLVAGTEYYFEIRHRDASSSMSMQMAIYSSRTNYTPHETGGLINKEVTSVVFHVRWLVAHYVVLVKGFMSIMKYLRCGLTDFPFAGCVLNFLYTLPVLLSFPLR